MAEIRINATGGVKLYDADDSHYAQIIAGTITSNVNALTLGHASADFNIPVKVLGTTPTLTIGDAGAEDTAIVFDGNAQDFHIGLDDSADSLTIGLGSTLGTTSHIVIDATGAVTKPLQPAFSAYMSADMTDIATNTDHTIVFDTERFDVNADFNTGTYTFTAPVTGKYAFMKTLNLKNTDANGGYYHQKFITSNETYNINVIATPGWAADVAHWQTTGCVFADMDASDTCYFTVHQQEGTAQADVRGGAGWSSFQGWLAS